jgi:hypothetical protein
VTGRNQPQAALQRSVIQHLRWCAPLDVWFCHIPNGGARSPIAGAIFKPLGVGQGAPDLIVRAGQALFAELKVPGRELNPARVECHDALQRAGALIETADNIDASAAIDRLGVLR